MAFVEAFSIVISSQELSPDPQRDLDFHLGIPRGCSTVYSVVEILEQALEQAVSPYLRGLHLLFEYRSDHLRRPPHVTLGPKRIRLTGVSLRKV